MLGMRLRRASSIAGAGERVTTMTSVQVPLAEGPRLHEGCTGLAARCRVDCVESKDDQHIDDDGSG
jgi:hypothetical protein